MRVIYLTFMLVLSFCSGSAWAAVAPKTVVVATVVQQKFEKTEQLLGTVQAQQATWLRARATGILSIQLSSGRKVKKGQLIAKIEDKNIKNNYEFAVAAERIAKKQYERLKKLLKSSYTSVLAVENSKRNWLEAQKALSDAKINLEKSLFLAPFDGVIGSYNKQSGMQVSIGDKVVNFYDPGKQRVVFNIPDRLLRKLSENPQVIVQGQCLSMGFVPRYVDPESYMAPADVNFSCNSCVIGDTITVDLVTAQRAQAIVVPNGTVFIQNNQSYAYVVENEQVKRVPVSVGLSNAQYTEILNGLRPQQIVVKEAQQRLSPGDPVKIYSSNPPHEAD